MALMVVFLRHVEKLEKVIKKPQSILKDWRKKNKNLRVKFFNHTVLLVYKRKKITGRLFHCTT